MSERYKRSEEMRRRALELTPLGAQTFSKSGTQLPVGISPYFIERAAGSRAWDVDGHEYIDLVNALLAVSLGHGDPDVNAAVRRQMERGVSYSLSHPLEIEVSERLVEMVPCADMVRFLKNGSDATAAAVRIARAATGRERVATCGYHGWHDWYVGITSRNQGVPGAVQALTHPFSYNDLDSLRRTLEARPGEFAAVILEPMSRDFPANGFLEGVQSLTHEHGAVLIFDEVITGLRLAPGGAQELFGVTPDLAAFGKGLANGYSLSAVAGRRELMKLVEEVFVSTTFGGETLSLAAARAVLDKVRREPVVETLRERGQAIMDAVSERITRHGLEAVVGVSGHPSWSFVDIHAVDGAGAPEIKTFWLQEMLARGVLTLGTHNVSYAFTKEDVDQVGEVYDAVLGELAGALETGTLRARLGAEPLRPVFQVRPSPPSSSPGRS